MLYAQIEGLTSLRDISCRVNSLKELQETINLKSISYSQLSRKLRNIHPKHLDNLFKEIVKEAHIHLKPSSIKNTLGNLYLIDSSTISLCLSHYKWAEYRKTKGGIKLHLRVKFQDGVTLPDSAIITNARPADKKQMNNLVVSEEGALYVFDRAYVDYRIFDDYCENNILFVTRLKSNAAIEVLESYEVQKDSPVISDDKVYLGQETRS